MATLRGYKYDFLIKSGLSHREATTFSGQYTMTQLRTIPYMKNLLRWRRLYVSKLKNLNYSDEQIKRQIIYLYFKNGWTTPDNKIDPWQMLRKFRDTAIENDEYIPPKRSHHPKGVSKGDVTKQRLRARARSKTGRKKLSHPVYDSLAKISSLNRQIQSEKDDAKRSSLLEERTRLWKGIS